MQAVAVERDSQTAPAPNASGELDTAVETIADVIRAFGAHAFHTDDMDAHELVKLCEGWASHLLVFAPPPTKHPPPPNRRLWREALRFVTERRKVEQRFVVESQTILRDTAFAFAHAVSSILAGDQGAETHVTTQLQRLRVAANAPSPEELRREVGAAVDAIEAALVERKERVERETRDLSERVSVLSRQLEEAKREGAIDPLTRIANRKTFDDHVARVTDLAAVMRTEACLLMIDIDHFKDVNDTYGHPAGDAALRAVCDVLSRTFMRKSDLVSRFGGEEFAVVLTDTSLENAKMLAERARRAVQSVKAGEGDRARALSVSIGIARLAPQESVEQWVTRADRALYAAKSGGRDRVETSE